MGWHKKTIKHTASPKGLKITQQIASMLNSPLYIRYIIREYQKHPLPLTYLKRFTFRDSLYLLWIYVHIHICSLVSKYIYIYIICFTIFKRVSLSSFTFLSPLYQLSKPVFSFIRDRKRDRKERIKFNMYKAI